MKLRLNLSRDKDGNYLLIKGSIGQEVLSLPRQHICTKVRSAKLESFYSKPIEPHGSKGNSYGKLKNATFLPQLE